MKSRLSVLLVLSLLFLGAVVTLYSSHQCGNLSPLFRFNVVASAREGVIEYEVDDEFEENGGGGGGIGFENQGPGPQGQRHSQAVQCCDGNVWNHVWNVKPSCCFGAECCSYNGCHGSYMCDGHTPVNI